MRFKNIPRLTHVLDCGEIGLPGMELELVLNPSLEEFVPPENPQEWETESYDRYARWFKSLRVPAEFSESGEEEVLTIDGPQAVFELERSPGFDPSVLGWAIEQYVEHRAEWLEEERKNGRISSSMPRG